VPVGPPAPRPYGSGQSPLCRPEDGEPGDGRLGDGRFGDGRSSSVPPALPAVEPRRPGRTEPCHD
jgi:hypothetical protein